MSLMFCKVIDLDVVVNAVVAEKYEWKWMSMKMQKWIKYEVHMRQMSEVITFTEDICFPCVKTSFPNL